MLLITINKPSSCKGLPCRIANCKLQTANCKLIILSLSAEKIIPLQ